MKPRKILIMGLPGAGKTTLAHALCNVMLNTVMYDGDQVRLVTNNWDFSDKGRLLQARAIGEMCEAAMAMGATAIASFICPTPTTREVFWGDTPLPDRFLIFVDRIVAGAYPDTNALFVPPNAPDFVVNPEDTVNKCVRNIMVLLQQQEGPVNDKQ